MADITRTIVMPEETSVTMLTRDRFDIPSENGKRHSAFSPYHPRIINDAEGVISEDNGALRIRPKNTPNWGTSNLAYGPFARTCGLTFAAVLLNGYAHAPDAQLPANTTNGNGTSPSKQLWQGLLKGDYRQAIQKFQQQRNNSEQQAAPSSSTQLNGNLAVGWFNESEIKAGGNPISSSSALVMHSTESGNGSLYGLSSARLINVVPQIANIPICLVTVLREQGAAYYAASMTAGADLPALPNLRPLAIDMSGTSKSIYASIDQSSLGSGAGGASTRIYDVRIAHVGAWQYWYGTAQVADNLKGKGALQDNSAETDQLWRVRGYLRRTVDGVVGTQANNYAQIHAEQPNGLIHTQIDSNQTNARVAFYWRIDQQGDGWRVILSPFGSIVQCSILGAWIKIDSTKRGLKMGRTQALQIRDDGEKIGIDLDGELLFELTDRYNQLETGLGFALDRGVMLHHLEAHPRQIQLPDRFDISMPYSAPQPGVMSVWDDLAGNHRPLHRSKTTIGEREWQLTLGSAELLRAPHGVTGMVSTNIVDVKRSLYTFGWHDVAFASLAVDIVPPNLVRNQNQYGRGGVVFWQDIDNYILIGTELDHDSTEAALIALYYLNGAEAMVSIPVGRTVTWGNPYNLRADFDGMVLTAYLDNKPLLYRAITDLFPKSGALKIRRVGLALNWQQEVDTGTIFENFVTRGADRLIEATRVSF